MSNDKDKPNSADGRDSYDSTGTGELIQFFNKNVTPYPTEVGGPSFDLIPIEKQKDQMVNVARMHGHQEYNRIMELVTVLQRQADDVRKRLEITDLVHAAKYSFQIYHGQCYWLAFDHRHGGTILVQTEWTTACPDYYEYICRVKWLGDYTWLEVDNNGESVLKQYMTGQTVFEQMMQEMVTNPSHIYNNLKITKEDFEIWQQDFTWDALHGIRYGQSFCNRFRITDNLLYYTTWPPEQMDDYIRKNYIDGS